MAKKKTTKVKLVAKPLGDTGNNPHNCAQGYTWNADLKKCVPNVG